MELPNTEAPETLTEPETTTPLETVRLLCRTAAPVTDKPLAIETSLAKVAPEVTLRVPDREAAPRTATDPLKVVPLATEKLPLIAISLTK
jgi:hypothetical protein